MTNFEISEERLDEILAHYGVLGMKWGKRSGVTRQQKRTDREAAKDAKEAALAKMYFGEGAGIRRRHINNAVKSKSRDPNYKEAFERHYANQDLAKAGTTARGQRKRKNASNATKKTAKGVKHVLTGNSQYANMTAIALVGAAAYARKTGVDKLILRAGTELVKNVMRSV
ncbi:hypothetical protein SEA_ARCADIA_9 [Arthrobacter phage Arcadia]|uniref:Uncharacterized protein n=7 Tax=Mudcatvirus TaxID=1982088 RepID=A0A222Z780_9CAUD|nr:hypothetical protein PQB74_gp09 [Arthrobacter phage Arcadia]YP_010666094.1 hypothetical protein PQB75_gp009 [Arthrobacter phage Tribby]YP_010666196.1 hypothetical protein PQB76_gp009 [Arthrobacter phage Cheesy]YP_010666297.1 hypothetical protein PQB77_gp09 [Arthrobacter phage Correa]YP_010666392.1 hypothetical protein PQB78_gp08 [Arthrobacter phage Xenomorph]YP_010666687.1 hypothetical protein PQB81_gp008 [Arthrobacter phage Kardesai]YP_010666788.1 hypothetical protein PQB82_gp09 [Arthroba